MKHTDMDGLFFSLFERNKVNFQDRKPDWGERLAQTSLDFNRFQLIAYIFLPAMCLLMGLFALGYPLLAGGALLSGTILLQSVATKTSFLEKRAQYYEKTASAVSPKEPHPIIKTNTQTFNHIFSFILDANNIIWYAPRANKTKSPEWQRLYLSNLSGRKIKAIKSDGENFMARVVLTASRDEIFYKKILEEKWAKGILQVTNLCSEPEDVGAWFSLPVIRYLYPKDYNKRLTIASNSLWAASHGGAFKSTTTDRAGREQKVWGVTSVYELENGFITIYDPYVPLSFVLKIPLPVGFKVTSMDVSASTSRLKILIDLKCMSPMSTLFA